MLFANSGSVAQVSFSFVKNEENIIHNESYLDEFFEKLYQLKTTDKGKINIVHIGDSHIQADYLTDVVRKKLQQEFGNAGRGLIVPGRVAGTNEPANIQTSSTIKWNVKRCVFMDQPLPIGIGGITLNTDQPNATINIKMKDVISDYSFNTLMLFYQKDVTSFHFSIQDTTAHELAHIGFNSGEPFVNYSKIDLPFMVNHVVIKILQTNPEQVQATLFGIDLENGKDGILYHAIGVNGAKYAHYNAALQFARQTHALEPDLFIISLGTNEAIDYPYLDKNFEQHIAKFVESLSEHNPHARFVFVTPPDAYRKKIKYNPGIEKIRQRIIDYAVENGYAFWDMYRVQGGQYSANLWRKQGLIRSDGIHFTKEGYATQGKLLYEAIMKGYNQYVYDRHP